jgi:hypothetical protein
MPAMQPIQFASQSYQARSSNVSAERLVNLYLEASPQGAKSPVALYGTPGLKRWATIGDGPIRGMIALGPRLFVVSGSRLFEVSHDGTSTDVGEIGGAGNVHLTANATHVAIVTNGPAYAANVDGITQLPQSNLNGATYQDGYGIFSQAGGQKFWITGIDDMTTIDGLDYSTADALAGEMKGCVSDHQQLWLFTEAATELWYNSGDATFPFARSGSGFIEKGCLASGSIAKAEHNVLWLGHDKSVYMGAGGAAKSVSTPAIHRIVSERSDPRSAWSFCYKQEEHVFDVLNFPDLTMCYDLTTGLWHERRSEGMGRWRANCYANPWGLNLVGDCIDGRLYELDLDTYTDDGDTITRQAVAPPSHGAGGKVCYHELFVDIEAGGAPLTGQGSEPAAMLDWSSDGGHTWSSTVQSRMGKIGEYGHRLQWNRLGASPQRHFRLTITVPVKVAILAAYVRAEAR